MAARKLRIKAERKRLVKGAHTDMLTQIGVEWPSPDQHPETGEPFSRMGNIERKQETKTFHHFPPNYPSREVPIAWETEITYDGDYEETIKVPTAWRRRSDEEWAEVLAKYERTKHDTILMQKGPVTIKGRFETESGSWVEGVYDERQKAWHWMQVGVVHQ